jgi:hypothetical protein
MPHFPKPALISSLSIPAVYEIGTAALVNAQPSIRRHGTLLRPAAFCFLLLAVTVAFQSQALAAGASLQWTVTTQSCGANQAQQSLAITNTGTTSIPLSQITIKFWVDDITGQAVVPHVWTGGCLTGIGGNPSCSHQVSGATATSTHFIPTCGPDPSHQADWEVTVSDTDGTSLPPGATWSGLQVAINLANYSNFVPGSTHWYSACVPGGVPATAPRYAVYVNGTAVSGAQPPSCRRPQGTQVLQGNYVPASVATAPFVGPLSPTSQVQLSIGLPLRNPQGLQNRLKQVTDPKSSTYRQYMTPSAFAAAYGPLSSDYQSLSTFATSHGLTVLKTYGNNQLIDVKGTAAAIQAAFNVFLNVYKRTDGSMFYAPDTNPSVTLSTQILQVHGLDNFKLPARADGSGIFRADFGSHLYLGTDLRNAYVPGVTLTGTGQTLALVEFDGFLQSDITSYENSNTPPLRNVPLNKVLIDGADGNEHGSETEVVLDIEVDVAMAPGLDAIYVYEGPPPTGFVFPNVAFDVAADDVLHAIATATNASGKPLSNQVSCSWFGFGGQNVAAAIEQFAAQGQSFFIASGDFGAYGSNTPLRAPYQEDEISWMTVVGGTELFMQPGGTAYTSERVWNDEVNHNTVDPLVSSGGIVTGVSIPFYQTGIATQIGAAGGNAKWRNIPDVAIIATGIQVVVDGNTLMGVGTSASAPLWAAFLALANQQAANSGLQPIGFANPAIYALGEGQNYSRDFHDVTVGTNSPSGTGLFQARAGYDLTTGWGTPTGVNLINDLAGLGSPCVNQPNGTVCGTNQVCNNERCVACTGGVSCVPTNPCHNGTISCSTGVTCVDTNTNVPDGTTGLDCVPANPCHSGVGQCTAGAFSCQDLGTLAPDGASCGSNLVCSVGRCGLPTDSSCSFNSQCASGVCANFTGAPGASICLGLSNTPCVGFYDCTTAVCSQYNFCEQAGAFGGCYYDTDCLTGRCTANGQEGSCLPSNAGGNCADNRDCTTDSCGTQSNTQCDFSDAGQQCGIDSDCTGSLCTRCGGCACSTTVNPGSCVVLDPSKCPE